MGIVRTQKRGVGDTRTAIAGTLKRPNGTVENLTGLTVTFRMTNTEGADKVAETSDNVSVTDVTNGLVQYNPQAADVDTEGTFNAYFRVADGSDKDTFPAIRGEFRIVIGPSA